MDLETPIPRTLSFVGAHPAYDKFEERLI